MSDDKRLEELFEELEEISDSALKKKLNKLEKIEPSEGFRDAIWAKMARAKRREAFLEGLFPRLSRPAWIFTAVAFVAVLAGGIRSGLSLYNKDQNKRENISELGISEFTSSYSLNSLEAWVVDSTLKPTEEPL